MALYNNILESVKFIAGGVSAKQKKPPIANIGSGRGMTSQASGGELIAAATGTVFACLQLRANGLMSVDMKAFREMNWEKEELANSHWINRLMSNPNPYFTYSQIFKSIQNWYDINGNAFVWTPTLGHDVPLQMWVLNPTRVRVIRGGDNFIQGYQYQSANDGAFSIPENEVIHFANLFPANAKPDEMIGMNIFGKGLVSSVLPYASIDNEVSAYLNRLFENDAVPPIVVTMQDIADPDWWKSFQEQWNESMPNYKVRAVLDSGMQLSRPPESQIGISFDSVSKDVRSQIAQVFGVPTGMLTGEFQNRATAEVQYAVFRQQTIDPVAIYMAEEFTRHFRRFENDVLIQAQPYEFADVDSQIKQEEFELKYGIKTINDARRERGYDTIQDGDTPMIANGFVPVSISLSSGDAVSVQPRAFTGAKKHIALRSFPMETADAKAEYWNQYDKIAEGIAVKLGAIISGIMNDYAEKQIDRAVEGYELTALPLGTDEIAEIQTAVVLAYEQASLEVMADFGIQGGALSGEFGQQMSMLAYNTNSLIVESLDDTGKEITSAMKEEIMNLTAANADLNDKQLAAGLQERFKKVSSARIRMIARTTATSVTTGSQMAVFKDAGISYVWMTERDERVRPSHARMDGRKTNASGFFEVVTEDGDMIYVDRPVGNDVSGKPIPAGEAVNCRCYLFPVRN